jgi:hypothetical protein
MLETPYFGNSRRKLFYTYNEPVNLAAYVPSTGALGVVELLYLRQPALVSNILKKDCDLPDINKVHENICYLAVQSLMADIGDPKVQLKSQQEQRTFNNLA